MKNSIKHPSTAFCTYSFIPVEPIKTPIGLKPALLAGDLIAQALESGVENNDGKLLTNIFDDENLSSIGDPLLTLRTSDDTGDYRPDKLDYISHLDHYGVDAGNTNPVDPASEPAPEPDPTVTIVPTE